MIDIHTHILPGIDDGAADIRTALQMIRNAAEGGTRQIILTPHCAPSYGFFNFSNEELNRHFVRLCSAVREAGIPAVLHPGMEVLYEGRAEFVKNIDDFYPLCGSRYFLMEYYFDVPPSEFLEGIRTVEEYGYVPIIAHPERYECVNDDWELALEGRRAGALFQINKGSLAGRHGAAARECAVFFLEQDAADFVASDAHDLNFRRSGLMNVYRFVQSEYGRKRAYRLFEGNPEKVIQNLQITDINRSR